MMPKISKTPRKDLRKISEMLNLGPACEKDFAAIGITRAHQIKELGPEKAFVKMLEGRLKLDRSASCCNALYLYALYGAIYNIPWTEIPKKKKEAFKKFTQELRDSKKFS